MPKLLLTGFSLPATPVFVCIAKGFIRCTTNNTCTSLVRSNHMLTLRSVHYHPSVVARHVSITSPRLSLLPRIKPVTPVHFSSYVSSPLCLAVIPSAAPQLTPGNVFFQLFNELNVSVLQQQNQNRVQLLAKASSPLAFTVFTPTYFTLLHKDDIRACQKRLWKWDH